MKFADTLKKAMIDKNISGAKALSEQCGVSYYIVLRLLKDDGSCRYNDLKTVALFLNVKIDFYNEGVPA
jgi:hypothetical protein